MVVILEYLLLSFGGITVLLLGLRYMSDNMQYLTDNKIKGFISSFTSNKYLGVLKGATSTALVQSSLATNVIIVNFVSNNIMSFYSACAVVMGANIGTTITAQLVSLSGENFFNITAIGALVMFIGFIISFFKNTKVSSVGEVFIGFGMLFIGLDIISTSVAFFKNYEFFKNLFLVKNSIFLLFNGLLITSILQSSSAVTSVMIVLASNGLITFESSMFLILGANIGTCLPVILVSLNKSVDAIRTAVFNLAFNVVGSLILFIPIALNKTEISNCFLMFSGNIERQIANFHTIFNVFVTIILLPILKPFTNFISLIIKDKDKSTTVFSKKKPKWV